MIFGFAAHDCTCHSFGSAPRRPDASVKMKINFPMQRMEKIRILYEREMTFYSCHGGCVNCFFTSVKFLIAWDFLCVEN